MLEIIPAIDIIEGKCVRLTKGDYDTSKVYADNPLDMAKMFEDAGIRRLHLVDLDGAKSKHVVNINVLRTICTETNLVVDFGGGIKTSEDLKKVFDSGASMATAGSIAVTDPQQVYHWIDTFGAERLILGADVRDGKISINGWKEDCPIQLMDFLQNYTDKGIRNILCTDIHKDGMLQGPNVELYSSIMKRFPDIHLIASGGVSCVEDLRALKEAGIPAVVFGKALYEKRIKIEELFTI